MFSRNSDNWQFKAILQPGKIVGDFISDKHLPDPQKRWLTRNNKQKKVILTWKTCKIVKFQKMSSKHLHEPLIKRYEVLDSQFLEKTKNKDWVSNVKKLKILNDGEAMRPYFKNML